MTPQAAPPQAPEKPEPGDCCGGGCVNCVYDLYEAALQRYQAELSAWRARTLPPPPLREGE